jgi:hypothetical protein
MTRNRSVAKLSLASFLFISSANENKFMELFDYEASARQIFFNYSFRSVLIAQTIFQISEQK